MVVRLAFFNDAYSGNTQNKHWPCPKYAIMYRPTCKITNQKKKQVEKITKS